MTMTMLTTTTMTATTMHPNCIGCIWPLAKPAKTCSSNVATILDIFDNGLRNNANINYKTLKKFVFNFKKDYLMLTSVLCL